MFNDVILLASWKYTHTVVKRPASWKYMARYDCYSFLPLPVENWIGSPKNKTSVIKQHQYDKHPQLHSIAHQHWHVSEIRSLVIK